MTASTDFLPFATGVGANVTAQAAWASAGVVPTGFTAGIAQSAQMNKAIRQATFIAAGVATLVANELGINVADDGNLANFVTNLTNALVALATTSVNLSGYLTTSAAASTYALLASFANSIGTSGYQKLPNGLILQWGYGTFNTQATTTFSFPIAFPNACQWIGASSGSVATLTSNSTSVGADVVSRTQGRISIFSTAPSSSWGTYWLAIGN